MADVYVRTRVEAGKNEEAPYVTGSKKIGMVASEELTTGAGNVYRFFKGLNPNLIPIDIKLYSDDAHVGETDLNIG